MKEKSKIMIVAIILCIIFNISTIFLLGYFGKLVGIAAFILAIFGLSNGMGNFAFSIVLCIIGVVSSIIGIIYSCKSLKIYKNKYYIISFVVTLINTFVLNFLIKEYYDNRGILYLILYVLVLLILLSVGRFNQERIDNKNEKKES